MLAVRAHAQARQIFGALDLLGAADADAAADIADALADPGVPAHRATVPAGAAAGVRARSCRWLAAMSQDRIANQIAAMTPDQRLRLVAEFPRQVGNTDGVPWGMRIAANRINIAQAVLDERDPPAAPRSTADCSARSTTPPVAGRADRQIIAFDPARSSFIELTGNLDRASASRCWCPV